MRDGTLVNTLLTARLQRFRDAHRPLRLELRTGLSREVSALVRRGDAALGRRDFADPDHDLVSLPLYREELLTVSQKRLVEAGFGLGMMPRSSVEEELRLGTLRELH